MEYRKLGNTDLEVSLICLGTMTWGQQNTEAEGHEQMDYALERGINFFDTQKCILFHQWQKLRGALKKLLELGLKKVEIEKKLF